MFYIGYRTFNSENSFHLKGMDDCSDDCYEDEIIFVGNNFKKKYCWKLRAKTSSNYAQSFQARPGRELEVMEVFIAIENGGEEDVEIRMMQNSSPTILIQDTKIVVKSKANHNYISKWKRQLLA